jgi:hypothetical protein
MDSIDELVEKVASPSIKDESKPFPFEKLPVEIRIKIYRILLSRYAPVDEEQPDFLTTLSAPAYVNSLACLVLRCRLR